MDIQTGLVCVGVFIVLAIFVFVISMFGIKEKTYEEAIAEQRKMPEESLLISRSAKDKAKDKKQKKAGKKVKEKPTEREKNKTTEVSPTGPAQPPVPEKPRVDFEEPEAEVVSERPPQEEKKKKKKDKVKPILLNKEEQSLVVKAPPPVPANHFEEIKPKDDLLLKRKGSKDDLSLKGGGEQFAEIVVEKHSLPEKSEKSSAKHPPKKVDQSVKNEKKIDQSVKNEKKVDKSVKNEKKADPSIKNEKKADPPIKNEKKSDPPVKNDKKADPPVKNEKKSDPTVKNEKKVDPSAKNEKKTDSSVKDEKKVEKVQVQTVQEEVTTQPPPLPKDRPSNKKKKSELATLQQMSENREGVNVNLLVPLVRKAELSRSEIQILIDLLLNKQQTAIGNSEWIEGRQDPVVKLKKQLAEKEKALAEEQEASQSFQSKLKELRTEFNSERSRLNHQYRQIDEAFNTKQTEVKTLTVRLQQAIDTHVAEKQALTQQNQQLQAQLSEDHLLLRKLQEEQGQAQGVLQQELHNQRQQLELHIAHLTETSQEAEAAFKGRIGELHAQLQEQETINASLKVELQNLRESQADRDGENEILREEANHLKNKIHMFETQAAHMKETSDMNVDLRRENEKLHIAKSELEHQVTCLQQREANVQCQAEGLEEELESLKEQYANYNELKNEANHLKSENEKLQVQTATVKDLQLEAQHLQEENERLAAQLSSYSQIELEAQQLREENESLAAQVTAMTERPAAEGRENGDLHYPEEKQLLTKEDVSQEENIVKQKELLLEKLSDEIKEKDSLIEKLNSEINTYKTDIIKLNEELESQRRKNNELRTKNWKVMEALSTTEKTLEQKVKESVKLVSEVSVNVRTEQEKATKQLLQRIFPDVRIEESKDYGVWLERFEAAARSFVSQQKAQASVSSVSEDHSAMLIEVEKQNSQLQAMVTHYKTIIEETEGMLNKLQNHVEQEESRWRQQLQMKESEIESIREERDLLEQSLEQLQRTEEMQTKLHELQEKLKAEEAEKHDLVRKYEEIQRNCDQLKGQVNLTQSQQHSVKDEENERLTLQLKTEQERNQDLLKEVVKLKSLVQIGQDSLSEEQKVVEKLQQQLDKLNGINQNHSVATNGPASEPSITESLSASPQPLSDTSVEKRPKSKKKKTSRQASSKQRRFTGWFRKKITPKKKVKSDS